MTPEEALERSGHHLRAGHPAVATYVMTARTGSLLFVSGHGDFADGKPAHTGKVGASVSVHEGQRAAEAVMLNLLGTVKAELKDLSRVARFLKLVVFVNAASDFTEHHLVANGATDLLVEAFGEAGLPTRSAVGVASLPLDFSVEIEAVVEVRD